MEFGGSEEERIERMGEGIEVIKAMRTTESFSYDGKHYAVKDAVCNPLPLRKMPIWMGEANHSHMVTHIVRHADVFNSMPCSPEGFDKKLVVLEAEFQKHGRPVEG